MSQDYVSRSPSGTWRIAGTRVSLDSIVRAYWDGRLPESMAMDFPSVTLEQVHGAIAYYLGQRSEVDAYLESQDASWEALRSESEARNSALLRKLRAASSATPRLGER